jgi:hypothetical protein
MWLVGLAALLGALALVDVLTGGRWLAPAPAPVVTAAERAPAAATPNPLPITAEQPDPQREADLGILINKPLFDPYRGVVPPPAPALDPEGLSVAEVGALLPSEEIAPPASPTITIAAPPDLRLVGILTTPSGPIALLESGGGPLRLRQGETVASFTLGAVAADRVTLDSPQGFAVLCLVGVTTCTP